MRRKLTRNRRFWAWYLQQKRKKRYSELNDLPCLDYAIAAWKDTWIADDNSLKDLAATGAHVAGGGWSLTFGGTQSCTVDLAGYEHLNAEVWTIEFGFYNSVAIDKSTAQQQLLDLDNTGSANGIGLGTNTSNLTDEIITITSGSSARSGYTSATESIAVGNHTLKVQWNATTTGYDIYLDGVKVNNATYAIQALLLLQGFFIGSRGGTLIHLDNTSIYDLVLKKEDGTVIFSNFLGQGGTSTTIISEVGPDVELVGFTLPGDWSEDYYGHNWGDAPGYSINAGRKIPADPDNSYLDVLGNTLTNPGSAQRNMPVLGKTATFDGATTALTSVASSSTYYDYTAIITPDVVTGTKSQPIIGNSVNAHPELRLYNGRVQLLNQNTAVLLTGYSTLIAGTRYTVRVIGNATSAEIFINGVSENSGTFSTSFTGGAAFINIGGNAGVAWFEGTIESVKRHNASDVLVNEWILEGSNVAGYNQVTAFDRVGGNDATFVGYTLPIFDTDLETDGGTVLARDGGRLDGVNIIPGTAAGTTLAGDALTFTGPYTDSPEGTFIWLLDDPVDPAIYDADAARQLTEADGTPKRFDPYNYVVPDPLTLNIGPDGAVVTTEEQTLACLKQTNDWMGK